MERRRRLARQVGVVFGQRSQLWWDLDDTRHLSSEAGGLRQRLAFDAERTTAAKVLAAVADRAQVLDLTVEEPDIEDVVRRIYAENR